MTTPMRSVAHIQARCDSAHSTSSVREFIGNAQFGREFCAAPNTARQCSKNLKMFGGVA